MPRQIIASTAAIATHHPLGAAAGLEMLQAGGNAVDAAVAAMLALCVVIPGSVGLGGYGGSAVVYLARSRRVFALDFDSRAPLGFRDGLVTADPQSNLYGARSVTVPAVVAGLDLTLREFGTRSWREVSHPAIRLADEGFDVDAEHKRYLNRCGPHFDRQSLASLFGQDTTPEIGDRWRQPDLAGLLRQLADDGPQCFYDGEIAQAIVRYLHDRGGLLTADDFHSYRPQIVEALHATVRGFDIATPPPPSGGITSLAIVQTMDRLLGARSEERGASVQSCNGRYFGILAETMKTCWRERHEHLADPDFVDIPIDDLLSDQAADARAARIQKSTPHSPLPTPHSSASPHTSNAIAIDAEDNLISVTATQGWMYGSHLVVDGLGLVLNHGMSRFDYSPGHPNSPAPGKRMQHNMSPMIALRDGRPAFALGMPGGPKIVNVTAQLLLDLIAGGATPADAIAAPRLHTEGDEPLLVSTHMPAAIIAELESLGHAVRREDDMGGPVNVLAVDQQTGAITAASGEGTGDVAGY